MKEICISSRKVTEYDEAIPITIRCYYIEGSGQLYEKCWREVYGEFNHASDFTKT